ncbi:MAG: Gfo/Idh/MocA family oxidoreductase [Deltaproteobacteria bacterium]|nr:Gfo/Idh/MocA family oxidoreductase [Deltaproteobacteria bacterium]MBI3079770.1 Gfo/Idh/MocA family oxidoreductase [Deltaproteobacteria bacterium]
MDRAGRLGTRTPGKLRGALVGFGNVAVHGHLQALRTSRTFQIEAVVDPCPARRALAEGLLPGVRPYESLEAALAVERLDFVDIATPPASHDDLVITASRHGLHVLCEKPLTLSLERYETMRKVAAEHDVALFPIHNWKYSPIFERLRALVTDGRIGEVFQVSLSTVRTRISRGTEQWNPDWRLQPEIAGGGIMVDHGWHNLYLVQALLGRFPTAVSARMGNFRYDDAPVEDTVHCLVEFPGALAQLYMTWAGGCRRNSGTLYGREGLILFEDQRMVVQGRDGRAVRYSFRDYWSADAHHPGWFGGILRDFQRAIAEPGFRREALIEAFGCLALIQLAYRSHGEGSRRLSVPPPVTDEA